jgi:predicted secreted acid phosphatase
LDYRNVKNHLCQAGGLDYRNVKNHLCQTGDSLDDFDPTIRKNRTKNQTASLDSLANHNQIG